MRLAITFSLCALLSVSPVLTAASVNAAEAAAPIRAADSCSWSAEMEDDEGGPVMVASSCASDAESGPAFRLMCGDQISIRYDGLGLGDNAPESGTMVLTSGGKSLDADVVLEEMDGALAAYVDMGSPVVALFKTGSAIGVTFKGMSLPPRMVSLKGSSAAIDKLINACK
ncbi:hypothetical protein [Devosia sp.]|uniref:hypothetical protein n=1 Tax=Devosia sp. TaxID=1871048 RepID=UPI003267F30F